MSSGRTHDRITLLSLPFVVVAIGVLSRSDRAMLLVGACYLFSGLMFAGDLDIHSQQYRRWLWLRWLWLPYRKCLRHRSLWSHGPLIGTAVRLLYLLGWLFLFSLPFWLWGLATDRPWWFAAYAYLQRHWQPQYTEALLWIGLGLELGAMSHSLSDWLSSSLKRWSRR